MIACSPQSEVTKAQLKVSVGALSSELTPSDFPGGLILYGKQIGGDKIFSRHLSTMVSDELIPNGKWNFVIIGWDDSGNGAMSGKPYCDSVIVDLAGSDIPVFLNVTNLKCTGLGPSHDIAGDKFFYSPYLKSCNILNQSAFTDTCEYNTSPVPQVRTKEYAASYKIIAKPFDNFSGGLNFQTNNTTNFVAADTNASGCTQLNETNDISAMVNEPTITANLPITNTNLPFFFTIRAYLNSTDCDDTKAYKDIIYHSKIFTAQDHANTQLQAKGFLDTGNNDRQIIFVKTTLADVCANSTGTYSSSSQVSPFSAGTGLEEFPYVICNEQQLSKIESNYESSSFILGKNLDLHPYTAFLSADTIADFQESKSNPIPCTNNRGNYVPIGGFDNTVEMADVCTGSAVNPLMASTNNGGDSFTGVFDGNGKTIKHLRFENDKFMNVGLIGGASGTPVVIVDNVTIKDSYIQARTDSNGPAGAGITEVDANVGSLVGFGQYATTSSISNIFVESTIVETEGEFSGGVIGQLKNTNLPKLFKLDQK